MRHSLVLLTAAILLVGISAAIAQQDIVAKFVARSQPYTGGSLPYRLFIPDSYDSMQSYPLILTLHGSGERGTDNLAQISNYRTATTWADPANQSTHPCFVAAPQCPSNLFWTDLPGVLIDLVDSLCREYSIDTDRLVVTGLSMGGYGTWQLITLYPEKFAAAIPMSAGWSPEDAGLFYSVPIWNFHGALDQSVPVSQSRDLMNAIALLLRPIVYTHGHGSDYRGLPDSVIATAVRAHNDVFYTEYQFGGHVIWDQSYDNPFLHEWTFDHYRRISGTLVLQGLPGDSTLTGVQTLSWTGGTSEDSVEIWWSSDAGISWSPITTGMPNTGSFTWNTATVADCGLGIIKAYLRNPQGHCYAVAQSGFLRIDNSGNGKPTVQFLPGAPVFSPETLTQDSIALYYRAADPEKSSLTSSAEYSLDTGRTYQEAKHAPLATDAAGFGMTVFLNALPNSNHLMLRIRCSDGTESGFAESVLFRKQSARRSGPSPTATVGGSTGVVKVNVTDSTQLTGHTYRVTFSDTSGIKGYRVQDLTLGKIVVQYAEVLPGENEGPLFDGLRLLVNSLLEAVVDTRGTRWTIGTSTHTFQIFVPSINFDTLTLKGYRYPADYRITLADHLVDTSVSTLLGLPAIPLRFSIWNLTEQRKVDIGFLDNDGNGLLSNQDEIYLLEPDSIGVLRLTWGMVYNVQPYSTAPLPGDEFTFLTQRPIMAGDTYEFQGVVVAVPQTGIPTRFRLEQNYPNPFNPTTTIQLVIGGVVAPSGAFPSGVEGPTSVVSGQLTADSWVRLVVYDLLGRKVAVLADGRYPAGKFSFIFDGKGLASGVYFCRLTAGSFSAVRKMILAR